MELQTNHGPMSPERVLDLCMYGSYRWQRLSGQSAERLAPWYPDSDLMEERYVREMQRIGK